MPSPKFPQVSTPIDNQGRSIMSEHWYQFFSRFFNKPDPEETITPGASPFSYQAVSIGNVNVQGGTVSAIALSRNGVTFYSLGATSGFFALGNNDILRVTYTVAPTMTFFPL